MGESQTIPAACQGTFANVPNNVQAPPYFRGKLSQAQLVYYYSMTLEDNEGNIPLITMYMLIITQQITSYWVK